MKLAKTVGLDALMGGLVILGRASYMVDLYQAKHRAATRYLSRHGVVGVGMGPKIVRGQPTAAPAVRFYVAGKVDTAALPVKSRLPREIDGFPTDVVPIG